MGIFFVFAGLMCIDMFSVGPQFEASLRRPPHVQKFREVSPVTAGFSMARFVLVRMGIIFVFAGLLHMFSEDLPLFESGRFTLKEVSTSRTRALDKDPTHSASMGILVARCHE